MSQESTLDIASLLKQHAGRNYELQSEHVNPANVRALKTIGFDRCYVRAEGPYLWDVKGDKYLDLLGGYGVFGLGRNHPDVRRVLVDFLQRGLSEPRETGGAAAGRLAGGGVEKADAEPARHGFLHQLGRGGRGNGAEIRPLRDGQTHGDSLQEFVPRLTYGALSINGDDNFREGFGPFLPHCRAIPFDDLAALEAELQKGDVAAFIVEPVQGKGVNLPAPGYLLEAQRLCRKHGALFVADEVQSGMGRTGKFLAIEHDGPDVDPDIVILAKTLSGGFVPVGAVPCKKWIHEKVFSSMQRSVVHSSTFSQGSFAMAAGLAALDVLDRHQLVANAARMGDFIGNGLRAMQPRFEFLKEIRWRGSMTAIEFGPPKSLGLKMAWTTCHALDKSLFPQAAIIPLMDKHRIITQVAGHAIDVIKLLPPLIIDEADAQWFLTAFEDVMVQMHKFPGPAWDVLAKIGKNALTQRAR